ncbi:hypothetical protein CU102_19630 [Phyllobacterium brassicacearum]|uniref:Alpha/beta hydrolase n=1 Tax=Phyllobacterium brassicacearum TaxID=314235 RepID=A0A2P7BGS7_9HYPH|nr:hypothetical protein CU102_19630 [Phyllobacterium brassicacearum]
MPIRRDKLRKDGEGAWPRKLPANPQTDFATLKAEEVSRETAENWPSKTVRKNPSRSVPVFAHGFNNRFEDAVWSAMNECSDAVG